MPFCSTNIPIIPPDKKIKLRKIIAPVSENIPEMINARQIPSNIKTTPKILTKVPSYTILYPFANVRFILPETSIGIPRIIANDVTKRLIDQTNNSSTPSHLRVKYPSNLSTACGRFFRPSPKRKWLWESSYIVPGRSKTPAFLTRSSQKSSTLPWSKRGNPIEPALGRFQVKSEE